jgi:hypothetical protein
MTKTSFGRSGKTFIVAHGRESPTPEEWSAFLKAMELDLPNLRGILVFTAGGSLNARQREQIELLTTRGNLRVAVLTDSVVVRGVVTALSWFKVQIKAFAPNAEQSALEHLGVEPAARAAVLASLREIKARVL